MLSPAQGAILVELPDFAATGALAASLARRARRGDVFGLSGGLGAGKTAFARYFIRARGAADEEVPSPTFTLVQTYETQDVPIWHFDMYRLEKPRDAFELGLEDALADGIALIEWPERIATLLPVDRLDIVLEFGKGSGVRRAWLQGHGGWAERLQNIAGDLSNHA